jgi:hypothetical protein
MGADSGSAISSRQKYRWFDPSAGLAPGCDHVLAFMNDIVIDDIAVGLIDGLLKNARSTDTCLRATPDRCCSSQVTAFTSSGR